MDHTLARIRRLSIHRESDARLRFPHARLTARDREPLPVTFTGYRVYQLP